MPSAAFAPWPRRALSMLIDGLPPSIALFITNNVIMSATTLVGVLLTVALGYLGSLAFVIWNAGYLQGTTGQSLGRRVAGTRLVRLSDGRNTGFGLAVGRIFAHLADSPLCIGYLRPLWDEKRQTFADKICGTVVVQVDR